MPPASMPEEPNLDAAVAAYINLLVKRQRVTKKELARIVDISPSAFGRCLNGTSSFRLSQIGLIANRFGMTSLDFLNRSGRPESWFLES